MYTILYSTFVDATWKDSSHFRAKIKVFYGGWHFGVDGCNHDDGDEGDNDDDDDEEDDGWWRWFAFILLHS